MFKFNVGPSCRPRMRALIFFLTCGLAKGRNRSIISFFNQLSNTHNVAITPVSHSNPMFLSDYLNLFVAILTVSTYHISLLKNSFIYFPTFPVGFSLKFCVFFHGPNRGLSIISIFRDIKIWSL